MKTLAIATGANVSNRWTITGYQIAPPTVPNTSMDGSLAIQFVKETLVGADVIVRESGQDFAGGQAFYDIWNDAAARMQTAVDGGATYQQAYYAANRDAMDAYMQRSGGPIPANAI